MGQVSFSLLGILSPHRANPNPSQMAPLNLESTVVAIQHPPCLNNFDLQVWTSLERPLLIHTLIKWSTHCLIIDVEAMNNEKENNVNQYNQSSGVVE